MNSAQDSEWTYYSISACDDHNFTVPVNLYEGNTNQFLFLRSTDGGSNWVTQATNLQPPLNDEEELRINVLQLDSMHTIAISDSGVIVMTSDAGQSWRREDYATVHLLSAIHFSDLKTGIIVGGAVILTTSDGGVTWHGVSNPPYAWMKSCHSYGNGRFRVFDFNDGTICTTNDNWKSWDSIPIVDPTDSIHGYNGIEECEFLGQDTIIAHGAKSIDNSAFYRESRILLSTDGGRSWKEQLNRFTHAWPDVLSVSNDSLWIGGGGGLSGGQGTLYSTNRGQTWTDDSATLSLPPYWGGSGLTAVQVVSPNRAIGIFNGDIVDLNLSKLSVHQYEREVYGTHVYPNPASLFVNIQSDVGNVPIYITDVLGREPIVGVLTPDGTLRVDISHLRSGIYQVDMFYNNAMLHITNLVVIPQ